MTSLLTVYLLILLLPLFVASWRMSLTGLSLQGLLMAWMVASRKPELTPAVIIGYVDLALVRGLVVPYAMARVVRAQNRPTRNDVIPPNMLSWALTAALIALGFRAAGWLHPSPGSEHVHVAVAASAVLLGLFVLATQNGVFSQAVGAMRLQNGIALFALGGPGHLPLGLQIVEVVVFLATALAYVAYVQRLYPTVATKPSVR